MGGFRIATVDLRLALLLTSWPFGRWWPWMRTASLDPRPASDPKAKPMIPEARPRTPPA